MLPTRVLLLGAILLAGSAGPTAGSVFFPPLPYTCKEFTVIRHHGQFHLFYMRWNGSLPWNESFVDLGHATSPNLIEWTEQDPFLPIRPSKWDNTQIWAPHIIERDSVFYLFYTAVTNTSGSYDFHQRIGLATSSDLYDWTRYDVPAFACANAAWTFCDTTRAIGGEFRDPFVIPDPAQPGSYLQYHIGRSGADNDQYLVGVARSTGDMMEWTGLMPFDNTHRDKTQSYVTESPHLIEHLGVWFLFYTTWTPTPICFQTSSDPLGPLESWGPQTPLQDEVMGLVTDSWFGSETFSFNGHDYFAAVDALDYSIQFREIVWTAGTHFLLSEPLPLDTIVPPPPLDVPSEAGSWRLATSAQSMRWTRLAVVVEAPHAADVRLDVVDVSGRLRRGLVRGRVEAGTSTFGWDGADDGGAQVGSGVYFLVLGTPERNLSRRVVRAR